MIVICGAGIAGVTAAYHLAVRHGRRDVVLVDEREPLSLTSARGTEAYRNWWPSETMVAFLDRSIDLFEEVAADLMTPRGYVFLARDEAALPVSPATEAELTTDRAAILSRYPFLTPDVGAMLHCTRCGWLDSQAIGRRLLELASVEIRRDTVVGVEGGVEGAVSVKLASGKELETEAFVLAAGPYLARVAATFGVALPVHNELHAKMAIRQDIVPPDVPLMIWEDHVHFRPRGNELLGIWTSGDRVVMDEPRYPPPYEPDYAARLLAGLGRMVPGLERCAPGVIDGGYYCRTPENRPLIGRLPVPGTFVLGALSGFGVMASQAAGELLAAHVMGDALPDYASAFQPDRYDDPDYSPEAIAAEDGQL